MIRRVTTWTTQRDTVYVVVATDRGEYVGRFPAAGKEELREMESGLGSIQIGQRVKVHVMDHTGFYLGRILSTPVTDMMVTGKPAGFEADLVAAFANLCDSRKVVEAECTVMA